MDKQIRTLSLENRVIVAEALGRRAETPRPIVVDRSTVAEAVRRDAVEVLIPDSRADLSPAQSVEHKLTHMLRGAAIPMSHIRLAKLRGKH